MSAYPQTGLGIDSAHFESPDAHLRVAIIGPSIDARGGIGRLMQHVLPHLEPRVGAIHVLDTRGQSANPLTSAMPLAAALARLVLLRLLGRVTLAHINVAERGSPVRKAAVVATCRLMRLPVVLHLHASSYAPFFDRAGAIGRRAIRAMFRSAAVVVVLGDSWRAYAIDELHVDGDRAVVLLNTAPASSPALPERGRDSEIEILFLGRLGERKGVSELLSALSDPRLA